MNQDDLYASRGPVSSMPGSASSVTEGTMCDQHADVPAVHRIQGETDSFGCEYVMMCQACMDSHRAYQKAEYEKEKHCDWCKHMKQHVRPHRDMDEGMAGPMYDVCKDCRDKESERLVKELEESRSRYGDYDDFIDDDDYSPDERWNESQGHGADLHHDPATDEEARLATFFSSQAPQVTAPKVSYKRPARKWERPS